MGYDVFQGGCLLESFEHIGDAQDFALDQPLAQPHDVFIICAKGAPVCLVCAGQIWTVDDSRYDPEEAVEKRFTEPYNPEY